jgi:hypothetical protein
MIVLEISTLAQSCGLFCRSSRRGAVEAVMRAFWADLDSVDRSRACDCDIGDDCIGMGPHDIYTVEMNH